ncbi:MAG: Flp pilus assembly protein CpaB [Actinobacteria bacterium]|nr:Flp pilus assembly protein CpaB [Actinomycetota bacterium]
MGRRTLLLVAAVLLAAIGTGALFLYFKAATPVVSTSKETVGVLAPARTIFAGTPLTDADAFVKVPMSRQVVSSTGMVTSFDDIKGKLAARDLAPSVPLTPADYGDVVTQPADVTLPSGKMAITIDVDDAARVSTFLTKGSRVAVYVIPEGGNAGNEARLILPDVTVLTIGSAATITRPRATATTGGSGDTASLVTLVVDQRQAGQILVAQTAGDLYLTLLGPDTTPTTKAYNDRDIAVG